MDDDKQIMEVLFEKYPVLQNAEFICNGRKSKRLKIRMNKKIKENINEEGYKLYEQYVVACKKRKEKIKLDELEESKKTLEWRLKYESENIIKFESEATLRMGVCTKGHLEGALIRNHNLG